MLERLGIDDKKSALHIQLSASFESYSDVDIPDETKTVTENPRENTSLARDRTTDRKAITTQPQTLKNRGKRRTNKEIGSDDELDLIAHVPLTLD